VQLKSQFASLRHCASNVICGVRQVQCLERFIVFAQRVSTPTTPTPKRTPTSTNKSDCNSDSESEERKQTSRIDWDNGQLFKHPV